MALTDEQLKEHTLNRTGHGVNAASSQRYDQLGFTGYINDQLDRAAAGSSQITQGTIPTTPNQARTIHGAQQIELDYSVRWKTLRPLVMDAQLLDVLADFWWNHFNVQCATADAVAAWDIASFEQGIANRVTGRFEDLMRYAAFGHEMMDYLDNTNNHVTQPNENLGREIIELHTLGIEAGYSQDDVVAASKIISGWNGGVTRDSAGGPTGLASFYLYEPLHDTSEKSFMGENYPAGGSGAAEQDRFLSFIGNHNATANRMAYRLCELFVSDAPPGALVASASQTFQNTSGDLRSVVRHILFSDHFKDPAHFRAKVKRPRHFVASVGRALGRSPSSMDDAVGTWQQPDRVAFDLRLNITSPPARFVERLGEVLFRHGVPTGYPNDSRSWMSGMTQAVRFELAAHAASQWSGTVGVASSLSSEAMLDALEATMLPGALSADTRTAAINHLDPLSGQQRLRAAVQLVLSSPEFVSC